MGWTNSVPILHDDITFIFQLEIPHNVLSFIDNVDAKGPKDWKIVNGVPAKHPANLCTLTFKILGCLETLSKPYKMLSPLFPLIINNVPYLSNCWIMAILMFPFELIHTKGTFHGPDGLTYLAKKYNLHHIQVLGNNKHANGIVEDFMTTSLVPSLRGTSWRICKAPWASTTTYGTSSTPWLKKSTLA
ncbi:hypothetical protein J132_09431 [Termitomyces sp. J132]|nr:hypothetical protein J132_09431 [Termitomyces sp. J132]